MEKESRELGIDCFKGILILLMVFAHCIQFFGEESVFPQNYMLQFINLHAFSGFLFAFGFVSWKAYYTKKRPEVIKKMLKGAVKTLLAFYLSGISFYALADRKLFRTDLIEDVLLIRKYPGWSEFLIAFTAVNLIGILLFQFFRGMNGKKMVLVAVISGLSCLIPAELIKIPQLGMLVGAAGVITFPAIPYLIYYALGVLAGKDEGLRKKWILIPAAVVSAPALIPYFAEAQLPGRFPPSAAYVFGGMFFVALLYLLCTGISQMPKNQIGRVVVSYLAGVGERTLFYLLVTNLIIFAYSVSPFAYRDIRYATVFYLLLMAALYYLSGLSATKHVLRE